MSFPKFVSLKQRIRIFPGGKFLPKQSGTMILLKIEILGVFGVNPGIFLSFWVEGRLFGKNNAFCLIHPGYRRWRVDKGNQDKDNEWCTNKHNC
jgi:hypothetical protein